MMQLSPTAFNDAQPLVYGRTAAAPDLKLLAKKHLPLVRRIAWHVHGSMSSSVEVEDLVQIGLVALVEAAGAFEERGQVTFEQYLMTRVRGAMIDALRRSATLTRGAMQRKRQYEQTVAAMTTELAVRPTRRRLRRGSGYRARNCGSIMRARSRCGSSRSRISILTKVRGSRAMRPMRSHSFQKARNAPR